MGIGSSPYVSTSKLARFPTPPSPMNVARGRQMIHLLSWLRSNLEPGTRQRSGSSRSMPSSSARRVTREHVNHRLLRNPDPSSFLHIFCWLSVNTPIQRSCVSECPSSSLLFYPSPSSFSWRLLPPISPNSSHGVYLSNTSPHTFSSLFHSQSTKKNRKENGKGASIVYDFSISSVFDANPVPWLIPPLRVVQADCHGPILPGASLPPGGTDDGKR